MGTWGPDVATYDVSIKANAGAQLKQDVGFVSVFIFDRDDITCFSPRVPKRHYSLRVR